MHFLVFWLNQKKSNWNFKVGLTWNMVIVTKYESHWNVMYLKISEYFNYVIKQYAIAVQQDPDKKKWAFCWGRRVGEVIQTSGSQPVGRTPRGVPTWFWSGPLMTVKWYNSNPNPETFKTLLIPKKRRKKRKKRKKKRPLMHPK